MKYVSDKMYDNKFWKYENTNLIKNEYFNRFEFHKNLMFESYTQPFQYLILERVLENEETKIIKLKKENLVSLAELMQFNIHN